MAYNDIQVFREVEGGRAAYPIVTGSSFLPGEPLVVDGAAGTIAECTDDPAVVTGIAASSSQGVNQDTGIAGTVADGTMITVYKPVPNQLFIVHVSRFAQDGDGVTDTPTIADVGDTAGFSKTGDNWFLDSGTTNKHCEIVAVLDVNKQPLGNTVERTAGTGVYVVFGFV
jgi:hypothetical protein